VYTNFGFENVYGLAFGRDLMVLAAYIKREFIELKAIR
jgi:hypothetical protein